MAQYIGIDIGAASTVIFKKDKGIVLREPTVAAVDTAGNVVAVGAKALLVSGRAPGTVTLRRPLENGNITDFNLMAETLDKFMELAAPGAKKHVIASVKYGFGSHNRDVLTRALADCKTGKITLADNAYAALLGSGFTPADNEEAEYNGSVVCDIGAGSIEVSYIRAGEIMRTKARPHAGDSADIAIIAYIRRRYGLAITKSEAVTAKHKITLAAAEPTVHVFSGTDGSSGLPRRIAVDVSELIRPCAPQIEQAAELITEMLTNLPSHGENSSTADRIILVGGGASMPGIAEYISSAIGRKTEIPSKPTDCVAIGLGRMIAVKKSDPQ